MNSDSVDKSKKFKILNIFSGLKLPKLKNNKKFYVSIVCLLSILVLAIFLSSFKTTTQKATTQNSQILTTTQDYVTETENRLKNILTSVKGISDVKVYLSVSSTPEFVYATDKNSQNSSNAENNSVVFSKNGTATSPVLVKTIYPEINGVLIVAKGAGEAKMKLMLCDCLSSVLNVPTSCIQILEGK